MANNEVDLPDSADYVDIVREFLLKQSCFGLFIRHGLGLCFSDNLLPCTHIGSFLCHEIWRAAVRWYI